MNTLFTRADLQLQLARWPLQQPNHSLQAWDAADELLLDRARPALSAITASGRVAKILILNDSFGALSCALGNSQQYLVQDSYIAQQACRHNRQQNGLTLEGITELTSLDSLPAAPDLVLLKLPANHSYLAWQLSALSQVLSANTQLLIAAKAKDIHRNVLAIFARYIGPTQASLTLRKCRYLDCQWQPGLPHIAPDYPSRWPLPETGFMLVNHANVFARDKPDIGARFFLQHLPTVTAGQQVIDLGCGNGMLSLQILAQQADCQLLLTDESYMAVESARLSVAENFPAALSRCRFVVDDCLSQQADNSADWVLCNPPFHQQAAVTTHIASQMFYDAKRVLKPGGKIRIVANRHLPYRQQLAKCFGNCRQLAANPKFIILESTKRS